MELNSLLILLEAAEYLERRDRGTGRRRAVGQAPAGAPRRSRPLLCGGRAGAAAPSPHLPGGDPGCASGTALGEHRCSDLGFFKSIPPQASQKGVVCAALDGDGACGSAQDPLAAPCVAVGDCMAAPLPQRSVTRVCMIRLVFNVHSNNPPNFDTLVLVFFPFGLLSYVFFFCLASLRDARIKYKQINRKKFCSLP